MEEEKNKIVLPKTLRNIFRPEQELRPLNGHIRVSNSKNLLIGHLNDFDVDMRDVPGGDYLVVFDKEPTANSKITIKTVNCYSVRVKVTD